LQLVKEGLLAAAPSSIERQQAKAAFIKQSTSTQSLFPEHLSAATDILVDAIDSLFALPASDVEDDACYSRIMDAHLTELAHQRQVWLTSHEIVQAMRKKAQSKLFHMTPKQQRLTTDALKKRTISTEKLLKAYQHHKEAIVRLSKDSSKEPPPEALPNRQWPKFTPEVAMAQTAAQLLETHIPLIAVNERRAVLQNDLLQNNLTGISSSLCVCYAVFLIVCVFLPPLLSFLLLPSLPSHPPDTPHCPLWSRLTASLHLI
jgi:hypothetical protein